MISLERIRAGRFIREQILELAQMKPGTTSMLVYENAPLSELPADHPDQPLNWTDYRLTADIEFAGGKAGVVWRCRDAGNHYRFAIDKGLNPVKCELFRVVGGAAVRLADTTEFTPPAGEFSDHCRSYGLNVRDLSQGRADPERDGCIY